MTSGSECRRFTLGNQAGPCEIQEQEMHRGTVESVLVVSESLHSSGVLLFAKGTADKTGKEKQLL